MDKIKRSKVRLNIEGKSQELFSYTSINLRRSYSYMKKTNDYKTELQFNSLTKKHIYL